MNDNTITLETKVETFIQQQQASTQAIEERLQTCLDFMDECLSKEGNPDFKGFWLVRQFCFPFFKEPISKHVRENLWIRYIDLTKEGRRLKSLLDVESSFAAEQISLAIQDLEEQVTNLLNKDAEAALNDFKVPDMPQALKASKEFYFTKQGRLHLFNVFASRIHGLRKELIKTEMRIKQKNGLFARLSVLGDHLFPVRKQLMQEINEQFVADVNRFQDSYFSEQTFSVEKIRPQVFFFRSEIKLFQSLAKSLTLDTRCFSQTRSTLSSCWDCLKGMEKELKKEFVEQKQVSAEHATEIKQTIEKLQQFVADVDFSMQQAQSMVEDLQTKIRKAPLVRADVNELKELLSAACKPIEDKQQVLRKQRQEHEVAVEAQRKEKVVSLQQELEAFLSKLGAKTSQEAADQLTELKHKQRQLNCHLNEKQMLDALIKQAKDKLLEKQQQALLQLPAASRQLLDELIALLDSRKARRVEIKTQLDEYRKVLAGSSLDIEKVLGTQELLEQEKQMLEKCDASILEIEKKIKDLKHQS